MKGATDAWRLSWTSSRDPAEWTSACWLWTCPAPTTRPWKQLRLWCWASSKISSSSRNTRTPHRTGTWCRSALGQMAELGALPVLGPGEGCGGWTFVRVAHLSECWSGHFVAVYPLPGLLGAWWTLGSGWCVQWRLPMTLPAVGVDCVTPSCQQTCHLMRNGSEDPWGGDKTHNNKSISLLQSYPEGPAFGLWCSCSSIQKRRNQKD